MKILQVVHGFPPYNFGGGEIYAYNLSRELAKQHEVYVFYRINDFQQPEFMLKQYNRDGIRAFTINNTFRKCASFEDTYRNACIAERFAAALDEIKPDVVHIQHLLYLSAMIVDEAKKRGIPVVFTLHDYWLICPQGQLLKNDLRVCPGDNHVDCLNCIQYQLSLRKNIFNIYYLLEKNAYSFLVRLVKRIYLFYSRLVFLNNQEAAKLLRLRREYLFSILSKVDLFISPSHFLKNRFIEFGIPKNKIIYSAYGFNNDQSTMPKKNTPDRLSFGFIGNIIPAKGLHVLIDSFNRIGKRNVELKIYGRQNSYKGALGNYSRRISKEAKNKNIKFMGGFDNNRIKDILAEIDMLVVPSIWYENSPLVIQEAFLARTPVLASDIGGIPELIEHGVNGLLFAAADAAALKKELEYVLDNPGMIEKFRQQISQVKSIKDDAEQLQKIYQGLIAENS